jgi:hypothetical protein
MDVTFTRRGERRYAIGVERPGAPALVMDPAGGYDPLVPHDLAHFAVERAYGIAHGVFGQLAAGGDVRTFRRADGAVDRRLRRRGERLVRLCGDELARSERLAATAMRAWNRDVRPAADGALERVLESLDELSERWRVLDVGESLTLRWPPAPDGRALRAPARRTARPRRRRARPPVR